MGWSGQPRIAPSELDLGKSLRSRRRPAGLQHLAGGRWIEIDRLGSIAEAQRALVEQVGEHHGDIADYRVVPIARFPVAAVVVAIALVAIAVAIVAFWFSGR